jgi:DNA polymerase III alpha subunit
MPTLLHVHSWYSLLEGTAEPAALVRAALEGGYTALALTDTNNLYGVVSFVESAHRAGLRPFSQHVPWNAVDNGPSCSSADPTGIVIYAMRSVHAIRATISRDGSGGRRCNLSFLI